jgi:hypothetical protein
MTANNSTEKILEHIASDKKYLVHEMIPTSGPSSIEYVLNLFFENGYILKTMSTIGLDTQSMNRRPITFVFEKI